MIGINASAGQPIPHCACSSLELKRTQIIRQALFAYEPSGYSERPLEIGKEARFCCSTSLSAHDCTNARLITHSIYRLPLISWRFQAFLPLTYFLHVNAVAVSLPAEPARFSTCSIISHQYPGAS